jgi:hypothetical protein
MQRPRLPSLVDLLHQLVNLFVFICKELLEGVVEDLVPVEQILLGEFSEMAPSIADPFHREELFRDIGIPVCEVNDSRMQRKREPLLCSGVSTHVEKV